MEITTAQGLMRFIHPPIWLLLKLKNNNNKKLFLVYTKVRRFFCGSWKCILEAQVTYYILKRELILLLCSACSGGGGEASKQPETWINKIKLKNPYKNYTEFKKSTFLSIKTPPQNGSGRLYNL